MTASWAWITGACVLTAVLLAGAAWWGDRPEPAHAAPRRPPRPARDDDDDDAVTVEWHRSLRVARVRRPVPAAAVAAARVLALRSVLGERPPPLIRAAGRVRAASPDAVRRAGLAGRTPGYGPSYTPPLPVTWDEAWAGQWATAPLPPLPPMAAGLAGIEWTAPHRAVLDFTPCPACGGGPSDLHGECTDMTPAERERWPHLSRPWADTTGTFPAVIA